MLVWGVSRYWNYGNFWKTLWKNWKNWKTFWKNWKLGVKLMDGVDFADFCRFWQAPGRPLVD
ncbi:hypothetical protein [Nisaea denitrificans]|uniref:hypothetical protein n=1 Tax=Nisaea denitrificans TaxID=390877 RepID=UPI0012EB6FB6|nr:hypothetical protein [Nisaea denitrificans]